MSVFGGSDGGDGGGRGLAPSRYEEDVFEGGHTAIFGSFYDKECGTWGYACCGNLGRGARCRRRLGRGSSLAVSEEPSRPLALGLGDGLVQEENGLAVGGADAEGGSSSSSSGGEEENAPGEGAALDEAAALRAARMQAELDRILTAPSGRPLSVLGLGGAGTPAFGVDGHAVRRAYRRIMLLVHPDKNPGVEARCKEAVVRLQEARDALERQLPGGGAGLAKASEPTAADAATAPPRRSRRRRGTSPSAPADLKGYEDGRPRESFDSAETFVVYTLLHCLASWQRSGAAGPGALSGSGARRVPGASARGTVAAFEDTAAAVGTLRRLVDRGHLVGEPLEKLERLCVHLLAREYVLASQVYLDLTLGGRTWHSDVPSLLEAGCPWGGRKAGAERGRLFKQARVAQRLNSERASSASPLDDAAVKEHLTSLKRLITVVQELQPHEDPSKNCL